MKAAVLGLGKTLNHFKGDYDITIGVNDIHSRVKTDYVVCIDYKHRFTDERKKAIESTSCKGFYSQLPDWQQVPNYKKIRLVRKCDLDGETFDYSNNSTYVACHLAYKMGAKDITLFGVDFDNNHKFFSNPRDKQAAILGFQDLKTKLNDKGVKMYIGHGYSKLSSVIPLKKIR